MTTSRTFFTPVQIGIIVLTLATAAIHIWLAFQFPSPDPMFMLNGIGYVGLLAALFLPVPRLAGYKGIIRWVLIGYTALTVVLYFVINGLSYFPLGYAAKTIETVLIALLLIEGRASKR